MLTTMFSYRLKACRLKLLAFVLLSTVLLSTTDAQPPSKKERQQAQQAKIKALVDSQTYIFNAQIAMPMGGRTIQLTGGYYDLEIGKTAIRSYLPYYGEAYSAPLDPAQAGIRFSVKDFDYAVKPRSGGGWEVLIKVKGSQEGWQLSLSISPDGYASLQVNGGNRQPISFNGTIVAPKR